MSRSISTKHAYINCNMIRIPEHMDIRLTEVETQLCTLLDECTKHLAKKGTYTSCRIAGGWVRDKLLGYDSHDIDIALENMTGHAFALEFTEFASRVKRLPVKSVAVVKGNPGQSKHLETAKTTVLGLDLDFVNLRDEAYADDSRIPTNVTFGTPLQDALRRDITNKLAILQRAHEGLDDLKNGIIRTPLPPKQTFLDDPLRVIRCVRFASRFGFELVSELRESARDGEIQAALLQKITRERVGEEVDKMMGGRNPLLSLRLLDDLSLFPLVFHIPQAIESTLSSQPSSPSLALAAVSILRTFRRPDSSLFRHPPIHPLILSGLTSSTSVVPRLYMACALTPYRGITSGTKNHYLDGIPALFSASEMLKSPDIEGDKFKTPSERVAIAKGCGVSLKGLLLRHNSVHDAHIDAHWTTSLLFSLIQELSHVPPLNPLTESAFLTVDDATKVVETYNRFVERVDELGLQEDVYAKPILDGHEIVRILGAPKPGQWTGKVLAEVIKWQLDHPGETKGQCGEWLKAGLAAGRISIEDVAPNTEAKRQRRGLKGTAAKKTRT
ncbi:hypothetical protein F5148DRAFT_1282502 [Russula earlei]|uniref:Uncharacterized protein n=1 Tax=Russula earlei TaxID=71964 RepID=A0ACC0UFI7_9AGAM|nr:hypothetical protein F5148DRAFT_1282502 [Russula earlei]